MNEAWASFIIVNLVQLLLFVARAIYERKFYDAPRILLLGVITGIPLGLSFDLILGKAFGLYSYSLGFGAAPLILNAAISNGLFAANVLVLRNSKIMAFYTWIAVLVVSYEATNLFFPMWKWTVALPPVEFLLFLLVGYLGAATLVAVVWHTFFRHRFLFLDKVLVTPRSTPG